MTPLVPARPGLWGKLEYVSPTRSFKDRGAAVMISGAADRGVRRVVADSSGNAGRRWRRTPARAGMAAEVFVPEATPAGPGGGHRGLRRPGGRRCPAIGPRGRGRRPGRGRTDRGLVCQPRLPARLRARRQDPGLRAVGTARRPARVGRRAGRQRHPDPRALAGLSGAGRLRPYRPPARHRRRAGRTLRALWPAWRPAGPTAATGIAIAVRPAARRGPGRRRSPPVAAWSPSPRSELEPARRRPGPPWACGSNPPRPRPGRPRRPAAAHRSRRPWSS